MAFRLASVFVRDPAASVVTAGALWSVVNVVSAP